MLYYTAILSYEIAEKLYTVVSHIVSSAWHGAE